MTSPKLAPLTLSADERRLLEGWAPRRKTAQALTEWSKIILVSADSTWSARVAAEPRISRATAGQIAVSVPGGPAMT
jgi:hypothetical protein